MRFTPVSTRRMAARRHNCPAGAPASDAGLLGIIGDDAPQASSSSAAVVPRRMPFSLHLLGQQVLTAMCSISSVALPSSMTSRRSSSGRGNGDVVWPCWWGGDEHHTAQVHRQLDEVVAESTVLLTIQYLQQVEAAVAPAYRWPACRSHPAPAAGSWCPPGPAPR